MFKDVNSSQTTQKTSCIENASEIVIYKMTPTSEKNSLNYLYIKIFI